MRMVRNALLVLVMLGLVTSAFAGTSLTRNVTFDPSMLEFESREGYNVVHVDGCRFDLKAGLPMLPVQTIRFAIPAGMRTVGVEVRSLEQIDLGNDFNIFPAQLPIRISDTEVHEFIEPDPAVYGSSSPYPADKAVPTGDGKMSGYSIAAVHVYPLEYIPASHQLLLNTEMELVLTLEESGVPEKVITGRSEFAERAMADRVRNLVVNPEDVILDFGRIADQDRSDPVEYAIITGSSYVDEFQPLADWKTLKGVNTEIFTTTWIYSTYSGDDNQEEIRNFIIDYEANHGLVYVLLGGDVNVVPARIAWDDLGYHGIRADLYYSDTDGDWNADGDSRYGEHPADNVDMYGDIYVGRAPVNTSGEVTNFVNQLLTYEGASAGDPLPTDYQEDMLFLAEVLWGPPDYPYSDGGILKDMIDNDDVPARFDPITKLYQDDGNLNYSTAMAALNAGQGITNHAGHCNYNVMSIGPDALYNSDMDAMTNGDRQGIFYSMGCYTVAFDYDNIAEHYVNNTNGGGVAFVGNSRYGWACPGYIGECVSDLYDRAFFHSLFGVDLYNLGITHADHKDYYVSAAKSDDYMRYALYELNALGDPEMPIWTMTPEAIAVSHPSTLPVGSSSFLVSVNTAKAPVGGAMVCLMKGTEVYEVGLTNASGNVTLTPDPATEGTMYVTVTGHNYLPYEESASVEAAGPDPNLSTIEVNDDLFLNPDGSGDSTMTIVVTAKNGSGDPIPDIPAGEVIVDLAGTSSLGESFLFCESGSDLLQLVSTVPTDAGGQVTFTVTNVSGCGSVDVTAAVQGVALIGSDVANVRSSDITGDGVVNYFDTYYYIPMLNAATGDCGNFNGSVDGVVNFLDTVKYLPALANSITCP